MCHPCRNKSWFLFTEWFSFVSNVFRSKMCNNISYIIIIHCFLWLWNKISNSVIINILYTVHNIYLRAHLWLFICFKTKLKKKNFFEKICFLQNIHYLQRKCFYMEKKFYIENFFYWKKHFYREKYTWKCKNIYISHLRNVFLCRKCLLQI